MADLGEMFRAPGVRFWRRLPGPIERVWAHLTDPNQLSGWYDAGSVIEPRETRDRLAWAIASLPKPRTVSGAGNIPL